MKKVLFVLLLLVLIGVSVFILSKKRDGELKFRTEKVVKGENTIHCNRHRYSKCGYHRKRRCPGVGACQKVVRGFQLSRKTDQVIAIIDPATFEEQVNQARANLAAAVAAYDKAVATVNDTKRTFGREEELFKRDLVARADRDTAETNYLTAKAGVSAAKAQIDRTKRPSSKPR